MTAGDCTSYACAAALAARNFDQISLYAEVMGIVGVFLLVLMVSALAREE